MLFTINFIKLQILKASPGKRLTVHFTQIKGYGFELDIVDGNAKNKTLISRITRTHRGKTITISSSSVTEFIFFSEYGLWLGGDLKMIVVEDPGNVFFFLNIDKIARLVVWLNIGEIKYYQLS